MLIKDRHATAAGFLKMGENKLMRRAVNYPGEGFPPGFHQTEYSKNLTLSSGPGDKSEIPTSSSK